MANEITVSVDQGPVQVSMDVVVVEGKPGQDGPQGPPGQDSDGATDPGDLTLIFDNKLIG